MADLFTVVGEGEYDGDRDELFLPDIDPEETVGWPQSDFYRELQFAEEERRYQLIGDEFDDAFAGNYDDSDYVDRDAYGNDF